MAHVTFSKFVNFVENNLIKYTNPPPLDLGFKHEFKHIILLYPYLCPSVRLSVTLLNNYIILF